MAKAKGSVAMTTISHGAITADGRTVKEQMYINDKSLARLRVLAKKVHDTVEVH